MATRFYLDGNANVTQIEPAADAAWEDTTILARVPTGTTKQGLAFVTVQFADADDTDKDVLFRQYVSGRLTAGQTITGGQTIKFQCRVAEVSSNNDMFMSIGVRVIAGDGSTVQKTMLPVSRDNTEVSSVALTNRQFSLAANAGNYTTVTGDRIVIEIGMSGDPNGTTHRSAMRLGSSSGTDLPENDTSTTDNNPWVELITDTLTFEASTQAPRSMYSYRRRRL